MLKAGANQWGTRGSNSANITLNADSEKLSGNVVLDNISTAILNLKNDTIFKGTVNSSNTAKSVTVNLDKTSNWIVTGTSYVTKLTDNSKTLSNIVSNGNTIYYNSNINKWLYGRTINLPDGGKLVPMTNNTK